MILGTASPDDQPGLVSDCAGTHAATASVVGSTPRMIRCSQPTRPHHPSDARPHDISRTLCGGREM